MQVSNKHSFILTTVGCHRTRRRYIFGFYARSQLRGRCMLSSTPCAIAAFSALSSYAPCKHASCEYIAQTDTSHRPLRACGPLDLLNSSSLLPRSSPVRRAHVHMDMFAAFSWEAAADVAHSHRCGLPLSSRHKPITNGHLE